MEGSRRAPALRALHGAATPASHLHLRNPSKLKLERPYGQHLQRRPPRRRSSLKVLAVRMGLSTHPKPQSELLTEVHEGSPLEVKPLGCKKQRPHGGLSKGAPFESPPWGRWCHTSQSSPQTLNSERKLTNERPTAKHLQRRPLEGGRRWVLAETGPFNPPKATVRAPYRSTRGLPPGGEAIGV